MKKQMLINTVAGQECRIAIVSDNGLEEYYVERTASASRVGNVYKGRVTNIESAIQAAFVDFGLAKNGFLHVSDLHPQYFPKGQNVASEPVGRKRPHRERPPIQECLRRGQEVLVQMTKEGIGTKGPTLTTYLSIPGRLLVAMPGMSRLGVSRKIEDDEARSKARALLNELKLPDDVGFIIRTAGLDRNKRDLQRDLNYLLRLWKSISEHSQSVKAPAEVYQESNLVIRTVRDVYDADIERIVCDCPPVARNVAEFLSVSMPRTKHQIEVYTGKDGLYHEFGIEAEIDEIYSRRVELDIGGSLVFDQTEALVAIDVNSGRFRDHSDAETTATKLNMFAAKEIARQLRLRDLGGLIVIDFIDMREEKNRRNVERAFRDAIKPDRAKTKILRVSPLGIVELTRQRIGPSLATGFYRTCDHCGGTGHIKSEESQALLMLRMLQRAVNHADVASVEVRVMPSVAHHLSNNQRHHIARLETDSGKAIVVQSDLTLTGDEVRITCKNSRGSVLAWEDQADKKKKKKKWNEIPTTPLEQLSPEVESDLAPPDPQVLRADPILEDDLAPEHLPSQDKPEKKSRRRNRRGGKKHKTRPEDAAAPPSADAAGKDQPSPAEDASDQAEAPPSAGPAPAGQAAEEAKPGKSRRRGRRGGKKRHKGAEDAAGAPPVPAGEKPRDKPQAPPAKPEPPAEDDRSRRPHRPAETDEDSRAAALTTIPPETQAKLHALFGTTPPPPPAPRASEPPRAEPAEKPSPEDDEMAARIRARLMDEPAEGRTQAPASDESKGQEASKKARKRTRRPRKRKAAQPSEATDAQPLGPPEPAESTPPAKPEPAAPQAQEAPAEPPKQPEPVQKAKKARKTGKKAVKKARKKTAPRKKAVAEGKESGPADEADPAPPQAP